MRKNAVLLGSVLMAVAFVGLVAAALQTDLNYTMVLGKIYEGDYASTVSGANVEIICNGVTGTRVSISDGTYGYAFPVSDCGFSQKLSVKATSGVKTGSQEVLLPSLCSPSGCVAMMNINVAGPSPPAQVSSGGGGGGGGGASGGSYKTTVQNAVNESAVCGNDICEAGEDSTTCPLDCKVEEVNATETKSGVSRLTGAVIGAFGGTANFVGVVVFVVALIAAFFGVRMVRARASEKQ